MADVWLGPGLRVRRDETRPEWVIVAPAVAGVLAVVAGLVGFRGVDLPAQLYRVVMFHHHGFTLWDSQWYGGHFTLDYSVLFPPVAGTIGVHATEILAAAAAALAFDRLVVGHFGRAARLGSLAFAVGTVVQVAIGQLPFLLGEALALAALWAATRERRWTAVALALAASLASPLAGAFLILGAAAWLLTSWPERRWELGGFIAAAAVPVVALTVLFPGAGRFPFPTVNFVAQSAVFVAALVLVPRRERTVRIGVALYLGAFAVSFFLPSAMGGNIERLGETLGVPLALCALWPLRRVLLAGLMIPLAIMDWGPALNALLAPARADASTTAAYYAPMVDYVKAHDVPAGRLEVVPTKFHWESDYVAPELPLARGWERQLDTADNALFYTQGALTASSYYGWLLDNGVRFVALPDAQLDYAATAEGRLVRSGVPGLTLAWQGAHWSLYSVAGSAGLVEGPARLVSIDGDQLQLDVAAPGTIHVKERYSARWSVADEAGCTHQDPGGWLAIQALRPGPMRVQLKLVGASSDAC